MIFSSGKHLSPEDISKIVWEDVAGVICHSFVPECKYFGSSVSRVSETASRPRPELICVFDRFEGLPSAR